MPTGQPASANAVSDLGTLLNGLPQVPLIQSSQETVMPNLDQAIANAESVVSSKLPQQYITGAEPRTPNIPTVPNFTPANTNNQPLTNQATSIREARNKNSFAAVANLVGGAANAFAQQKNLELKNKITDVMRAQQNIQNASAVLQNDPNNAQAKQVLQSNKDRLNTILRDHKWTKQLQKAFDISFTDMEQNKTPEIGAMVAATKEFKQSGAFNYDNPAEAKVAAQANAPNELDKLNAQKNELGGQLPAHAEQVKSDTPYADKFLNSNLQNISENPAYVAAYKQQQDVMKQVNQYLIPNMIKAQVQAAKDGNANARANLTAASSLQRNLVTEINKANIADQNAKNQALALAQRLGAEWGMTKMRVDAALQLGQMRADEVSMRYKLSLSQDIDKKIKDLSASVEKRQTDLSNSAFKPDDNFKLAQELDEAQLKAWQQLRNQLGGVKLDPQTSTTDSNNGPGFLSKLTDDVYALTGMDKIADYIKGSDTKDATDTTIESVGSSDSDESDPDDDDDKYGQ